MFSPWPRLNVMKMLHGFARGEGTAKQKTVLATIHQPSEEVFNLFDKVPGIPGKVRCFMKNLRKTRKNFGD